MTQVIYDGQGRQVGVKQSTFEIPDRQEKIRRGFLEGEAKHLQKASQWRQQQDKELLDSLRTKAKIESDNRKLVKEAHTADNKRISKQIVANKETEIKNLRVEADNLGRQGQALAKLAPSIGKVIEHGDRILDEMAAKKMNDAYYNGGITEEPSEGSEKLETKQQTEVDTVRENLSKQGYPDHIVQAWTGYTRREQQALKNIHAKEKAPGDYIEAQKTGVLAQPFFEMDGVKYNLQEARIAIDQKPYEQRRVQGARLLMETNRVFRESFKGEAAIGRDRFIKYYQPVIDKGHDAWIRAGDNVAEGNAKREQLKVSYTTNISGEYDKAIKDGLSPVAAIGRARSVFMKGVLPGQTLKERSDQWNTYIIAGVKSYSIDPFLARAYLHRNKIEHSADKASNDALVAKAGGDESVRKLRTIAEVFPKQAEAVERAIKSVEEETQKQQAAEQQRIALDEKIKFAGVQEQVRAAVRANPEITKTQIKQMFIGTEVKPGILRNKGFSPELMNKIETWVKKSTITVYEQNAVILEGTFERMLWSGTLEPHWIMQQEIPPATKSLWEQKFESFGGLAIYKARKTGLKNIDATLQNIVYGRSQLKDLKSLHPGWIPKINFAKREITKRALELYPTFVGKDGNTKDMAMAQAFQAASKEFFGQDKYNPKKMKEPGNYWAAKDMSDREQKGVSEPLEDIRATNPYEELTFGTQGKTWPEYFNDGRAPENYDSYVKPEIKKLQMHLETGEGYSPSAYVMEASRRLGMSPYKFVFLMAEKFDKSDHPDGAKYNLKWEESIYGKAEARLAEMSPSIRQLLPDQLPSKRATDIVYTFEVLSQLNLNYGDIDALASNPELDVFLSEAVKAILARRNKLQEEVKQ